MQAKPVKLQGALVSILWLTLAVSPLVVGSTLRPTEKDFLAGPNAKNAKENLRFITSQPHVAGTEGDWVMGHYVSQKLTEAGIPQVSTYPLDVLLNYPVSPPNVTLRSSVDDSILYKAKLSEDILEFDDTSDTFWRNHSFHGYSPSGSATAPAVYANYGRREDFEALEKAGIDLKGKIVIVRYGQCFRGLKVMNAQSQGALAVLIYSDPADDGYSHGSVYPNGPWRSPSSFQRGSVQFISKCAGDPMRADPRYKETVEDICGVGNYSELIPNIPSVPMGYGDALVLLQSLGGKSAKDVGGDDFVGALDLAYTVGPSKDVVIHVSTDHLEEVRTIPNIVGVIPGTLEPEEDMPILLGNHRDAWVYGAADPNSGTVALIEVARSFGKLLKNGWKPLRTIYLLSWSGEEYGLLGSTGWAELNYDKLLKRAAVYLNVDTVVSGDSLSVSATPALASAWEQVLTDLQVSKHRTEFENEPVGRILDANANWVMNRPDIKVMGSGSDYTAFLDHFGIASLDFSFGKASGKYGVYHSIYDSFAWVDAFGGIDEKPGSSFDLIEFSSKIWGLLALRMADSDLLPFNHTVQGEALLHYTEAIEKQAGSLDLSDLQDAVVKYNEAAKSVHSICQTGNSGHLYDAAKCNEILGLTERQFLDKEGLPERPWFKHVLQAPGLFLGYAAEAFPGIQQAIDDSNLNLAQEQVGVVAKRIHAAAVFLQIHHENDSVN